MVTSHLTKFGDGSGDLEGYWGPVTSTLDWCEKNYVVSYYVAEWWNTISSFLMSIGGIIGIYWSLKRGHPYRIAAFAMGIALVGFGSAAFHGTLLFQTQLLDELPMIYAMLLWWNVWFSCLRNIKNRGFDAAKEGASPRSKTLFEDPEAWAKATWWLKPLAGTMRWIRIQSEACSSGKATRLAQVIHISMGTRTRFLFSYAMLWSIVHAIVGFTTVFQTHFMLMVIVSVLTVLEFRRHFQTQPEVLALIQRWCLYYVLNTVAAFIFWILDNTLCDYLHSLPVYPQYHAVWHIFVGFATYSGFVVTAIANQIAYTAHPLPSLQMKQWWHTYNTDQQASSVLPASPSTYTLQRIDSAPWQFASPVPRVEKIKFNMNDLCGCFSKRSNHTETHYDVKKSGMTPDDECSLSIPYCWVEGPSRLSE